MDSGAAHHERRSFVRLTAVRVRGPPGREAHGSDRFLLRPCSWVPTRGTPTGLNAPANVRTGSPLVEGWALGGIRPEEAGQRRGPYTRGDARCAEDGRVGDPPLRKTGRGRRDGGVARKTGGSETRPYERSWDSQDSRCLSSSGSQTSHRRLRALLRTAGDATRDSTSVRLSAVVAAAAVATASIWAGPKRCARLHSGAFHSCDDWGREALPETDLMG